MHARVPTDPCRHVLGCEYCFDLSTNNVPGSNLPPARRVGGPAELARGARPGAGAAGVPPPRLRLLPAGRRRCHAALAAIHRMLM